MSEIQQQAVKTLIEKVAEMIDAKISQNNSFYVSNKFKNWRVTGNQIAPHSIEGHNLADGSIPLLKVQDFAARFAEIAVAEIETAIIDTANIRELEAYVAIVANARIANAIITGAQIENASITTAKIALGAITTALIETGAIGTAQIADGSITDAKVVSLNADVINAGTLAIERLLLKGANGLFYAINATDEGLSSQQLSQDEYKNQMSGTVLVARSVTADKIAAKTITANEIFSGTITGDEISGDTIEGRHVKAGEITTNHVSANFGETLDLSSNEGINLIVEDIEGEIAAVEVTANKIGWLVESGESAAEMELTDRVFDLVADDINFNGRVTFSGIDGTTQAKINKGDSAGTTINDWKHPGKTTINGGRIEAKTIEIDALKVSTIEALEADLDLSTNTSLDGMRSSLSLKADSATLTATANNLQGQINAMPGQIDLKVGAIQPGGLQYLRNTTFAADLEHWGTWSGNPNAHMRLSDTEMIGDDRVMFLWSAEAGAYNTQAWQNVPLGNESGLFPGDDIAISADIKYWSTLNQAAQLLVRFTVDGVNQYSGIEINPADLSWEAYRRFSHATKIPIGCTAMMFFLQIPSQGGIYIAHPKLERGNKATEWSPHPGEFRAGNSVTINEAEMLAQVNRFRVAVTQPGGAEDKMIIDEDGAEFASAVAPDIAPRYTGASAITINPSGAPSSTVYTSLSDFLSELNGRMIDKTITVSIAPGATLNENVVLWGIYGGGALNIRCTGRATVNGLWYLSDCAVRMSIDNLNLASRDATTLSVTNCRAVKLNNLHINANNTPESAVQMLDNSGVEMTSCEVYNALRLIRAHVSGGRMVVGNVKGGHQSLSTYYSLTADAGSEITCYGKIPGGTVTRWNNGQIYDAGTTIDTGSAPNPTPVQTTKDYNATLTGWHQNGWSSETQMRQGYTNAGGVGITGGMWFNNTIIRADLSGKTILSATLRLYRKPSGRSNAIEVYLYGTSDANKGGNQVRTKSYGKLGTIARSTGKEFAIPTAAITDLRAGTINGLYLWTGETSAPPVGYSDNYGTFGGTADGADRVPQLTITYE